ncbi:hypothetical protein BN2475_70064 [Paraburkholderia ribeironis]|uniref:Uncharacterized protein n=1 Tax=Paraburkholderia ribeironis TaxID=1247936 RepID=A0A1N7RLT7_9BURK|nr:hypothetical protein BN2475_70064 [Paraburkholderia ribeironis]
MADVTLRRGARLTRDGHQVGDLRLPVHLPILVPKWNSTASFRPAWLAEIGAAAGLPALSH